MSYVCLNACLKTLKDLESRLHILELEDNRILVKANEGILLSKMALKEIRKEVGDNGFNSDNDEIYFFKHIKPQIYSKLIYYSKLFSIESKRPRGKKESQAKYLNCEIAKLQIFFNDNFNFYQYCRIGETQFDELYFLRKKVNTFLFSRDLHFITDEQFSTNHDSTLAKILAYDFLILYINNEIDNLSKEREYNDMYKNQYRIVWTGNKIDLVELIYALYTSGSINRGAVEIKDIARIVERIFKVDLGNYYHKFIEIKSRKINQAKYLDRLKKSFLDYIEKSDE